PQAPAHFGSKPDIERHIGGLPPLGYTSATRHGPYGEVISAELVFADVPVVHVPAIDRAGEIPLGTAPDKALRGAPVALDHLGLLVDDVEAERAKLAAQDVHTDRIDGPNTRAVFVTTAGGVRVELIEHLPEFALV
ncbi:MAG: hypothetical protein H7123_04205, partial [Thermoleophilia bacterium]|nr:hypothetical protein [Thermoleophilia bacterium]